MTRTLLVGLWLAVVLATSATAWAVIREAGDVVATQPATTPAASTAALPSEATPSPDTKQSPTLPAPSHGSQQRSWQDSPGTVVTACTGSQISLRGAQANPGWHVEVDERGPEEVHVKFEQGDDGRETEVQAECASGEPRYRVSGGS